MTDSRHIVPFDIKADVPTEAVQIIAHLLQWLILDFLDENMVSHLCRVEIVEDSRYVDRIHEIVGTDKTIYLSGMGCASTVPKVSKENLTCSIVIGRKLIESYLEQGTEAFTQMITLSLIEELAHVRDFILLYRQFKPHLWPKNISLARIRLASRPYIEYCAIRRKKQYLFDINEPQDRPILRYGGSVSEEIDQTLCEIKKEVEKVRSGICHWESGWDRSQTLAIQTFEAICRFSAYLDVEFPDGWPDSENELLLSDSFKSLIMPDWGEMSSLLKLGYESVQTQAQEAIVGIGEIICRVLRKLGIRLLDIPDGNRVDFL